MTFHQIPRSDTRLGDEAVPKGYGPTALVALRDLLSFAGAGWLVVRAHRRFAVMEWPHPSAPILPGVFA